MKTTTLLKMILVSMFALVCGYFYASPLAYHGKEGQKKTSEGYNDLDTTLCLQLNGKISKSTTKSENTYTVQLLQHNVIIDSMIVMGGKNFDFVLRENSWYGINIKKTGCVSKLISVSTNLPSHTRNYFYKLNFEVDEPITDEEASYLDKETLDFPMAIFAYDDAEDNFYYNEKYSQNIKKVLISTIHEEPKQHISANYNHQNVIRPKW